MASDNNEFSHLPPKGTIQRVTPDGKDVEWVTPPKTHVQQLLDRLQLLETRVYELENRLWRMEHTSK